jgi:cystathionine beta-lyase
MTRYDFDEIIDRKGSGAIKADALEEKFGRKDLIPMWVADMDFRTGDFIIDAIKERCDHGIFGYTRPSEKYFPSIINWINKRHQWKVEQDWLSFIPGIVKGIAFCVMNFTKPRDKIIIQPPVYHPFHLIPERRRRTIIHNALHEIGGKYRMNLDHLRKVIDKDCKMLILCNPQNPIGITWDKATLIELAEICYEKNILVISDEIHSDLAIFGNKHIPFASVSEKAKANSITFMAPSKTFNIAGIVSSYSIVPDKLLRTNFYNFLQASELNEGHLFAYAASEAAYRKGENWLSQLNRYLENNITFTDQYLKNNIPQIKAIIPQASFLMWLDCRELGLFQEELVALFVNNAGLALNDGSMFGPGGKGFMRMNIGCPLAVIQKALNQLNEAVSKI